MAKKQTEIPGTRLDSEPQPQKPIKALDDAREALERARGKVARAGQVVVEAKKLGQALLVQHDIPQYEYEDANGVLKRIYRKETIATCKVKVEKRTNEGDGDGDDE